MIWESSSASFSRLSSLGTIIHILHFYGANPFYLHSAYLVYTPLWCALHWSSYQWAISSCSSFPQLLSFFATHLRPWVSLIWELIPRFFSSSGRFYSYNVSRAPIHCTVFYSIALRMPPAPDHHPHYSYLVAMPSSGNNVQKSTLCIRAVLLVQSMCVHE